jgi:flagellar hook-basal body complex protein FliE
MQIEPISALGSLRDAARDAQNGGSFGDALGSAIDGLSHALARADALAATVASGQAGIAEASIARAKADVMLEVAAITAARVSGAISQLLQTQV